MTLRSALIVGPPACDAGPGLRGYQERGGGARAGRGPRPAAPPSGETVRSGYERNMGWPSMARTLGRYCSAS